MKLKWLIFLLLPVCALSQVAFKFTQSPWGKERTFSGVAVGVHDLNGDHLDDLIILDDATHLRVYQQTLNSLEFKSTYLGKVSQSDQFSTAVGDLDNDGTAEILVGGFYDGIKIYKHFEEVGTYLPFTTTTTNFYTQNISLVDLDSDGFLDIFVNDDDGKPKLFRNIDGSSFEAWEPIDFGGDGESVSGNYGSVWTDFDMDGDLDLYISKCRLSVNDSTDPRRINKLYVNDNGVFVDHAADFGLASGEQTWVSDFVDLDNDLDLDVVLVNHTGGNEIYENVGEGQYLKREIGTAWNQVYEGLQLLVRDFDNDGWKDILIAGFESKIFWNKGGFKFEEGQEFLDGKEVFTIAAGDLNHDGQKDFVAGYAENLVQRSKYGSDEVLLNQGSNDFVQVSLVGEESNRDAVGAKVYLHTADMAQLLERKSGYSYGITNSSSLNFGIPEGSEIDSLVIIWPTGMKTLLGNIDPNKHYIINENGCVNEFLQPVIPSQRYVCTDEDYVVSLPGFENYAWSDGSVTEEITIQETGFYNVTVSGEDGCEEVSGLISTVHERDFIKPEIVVTDPKEAYCAGEGIVLSVDYDQVRWSTGQEGPLIYESAMDSIFAEFLVCDELVRSNVLFLNLLEVDTPFYQGDTILEGEDALFRIMGDSLTWYREAEGGVPFYAGEEWVIPSLEGDTTLYVENTSLLKSFDYAGLSYKAENANFPSDNTNGGLVFSVRNYQTTLMELRCFTEVEAMRRVQVLDYWGRVVIEKEVLIGPRDSVVNLGFTLNPSNYYLLTTDSEFNIEQLGTKSPQLFFTKADQPLYPLVSDQGNVRLEESTGSANRYYSFYNLIFEEYNKECTSERVSVTVHVDQSSSVIIRPDAELSVYPNPVGNEIRVLGLENDANYVIFSAGGILHSTGIIRSKHADVSALKSGLYFLKIGDGRIVKFAKL